MSREKSEKVCITFRLSEEEHEKLKQYSSACGLSTVSAKYSCGFSNLLDSSIIVNER